MNRFIFEVYKGDEMIFSGTAKEVKQKYYISALSPYSDHNVKLLGEYTVVKKVAPYYPNHNDVYYYFSTLTDSVQKDHWKEDDTNCLLRWSAENVFKSKDNASKYGRDNMLKIKRRFIKEKENGVVIS